MVNSLFNEKAFSNFKCTHRIILFYGSVKYPGEDAEPIFQVKTTSLLGVPLIWIVPAAPVTPGRSATRKLLAAVVGVASGISTMKSGLMKQHFLTLVQMKLHA
jgi:hypothetical protein